MITPNITINPRCEVFFFFKKKCIFRKVNSKCLRTMEKMGVISCPEGTYDKYWSKLSKFLKKYWCMQLNKGESHIDFRMQCVIITLEGGKSISKDILKFRKFMEFQNSWIVIYLCYIYLIIDGKRSFIY